MHDLGHPGRWAVVDDANAPGLNGPRRWVVAGQDVINPGERQGIDLKIQGGIRVKAKGHGQCGANGSAMGKCDNVAAFMGAV